MSQLIVYGAETSLDVIVEDKYGEVIAELSQAEALDLAQDLTLAARRWLS